MSGGREIMRALGVPGVTHASARLFAYYVARANGDKFCWPGIDETSRALNNMPPRTIQAGNRALVEAGRLRIERRLRDTNHYFILDPDGLVYGDPAEIACNPAKTADQTPQILRHSPANPAFDPAESAAESISQESLKEEKKNVVLRTTAPAGPVAVPPIDIRRQLWEEGKDILWRIDGQGPQPAGTTIGRLLKEVGQSHSTVLDALRAADQVRPTGNLMAWLFNAVRSRSSPRGFDPDKLSGAGRALWNIKLEREALERENAA